MYPYEHRHSFLYPKLSLGNSSSEKTLNLNDIKINRVSFKPITTKSIDAKHFVDLACVDQPSGLKMMMSIEKGKLILIAAKNRGLIRYLRHLGTKYLTNDKVKHSCYGGTLDWPDNDIVFERLWVDRQQRLCARVKYRNQSRHNVLLKLNPRPFDQIFSKTDGSECNFPLSISIHSLESNDSEYAPTPRSVKIQLKSGKDANVTFDKSLVTLKLGESIEHLTLPISRDEKIEDIKPCGEWLQVAISQNTDKKSRILYINIDSLTLNGECLPIISSSPPIAFFHSACNNSEHYRSASPFEDSKLIHIGNNCLPVSRLFHSIKHRFASGRRKWRVKGKWAAIFSLIKAPDPGIQSLVALGHSRYDALKINDELKCKVDKLDKELADIETLSSYWKNDTSLLHSVNVATLRLKPNKSKVVGSVNKIIEQIELATHKLKLIKPLFSYDENVGSHPMAEWFEEQENRIKHLQSRIDKSDYDGLFSQPLDDLKNELASLSKAKESPIKAKEFDLLCAFVERTILNVHVLLSSNSVSGYGSALYMKLYNEAEDELTKAITRQHFGSTAWRTMEKTCLHLAYSLKNKHTTLGKVWSQMNMHSPHKPNDSLDSQIAARMSAMPEGSSLTFTTTEGAEVFLGYALFGFPLIRGLFAAVMPTYKKEYSMCLESLGNGKAKQNISRKKVTSVTAVFGTGQGLEDLTQLVKHDKGSVVTVMPFEGNAILQIAKESTYVYSFIIKNDGISNTLADVLKIDSADNKKPERTDMQYESGQTLTFKGGLEMKSEFRLQNGVSAGSSSFLVIPRYGFGMAAVGELTGVKKSETKIGSISSVEATAEWSLIGDVSHRFGSTVMPVFIFATHDSGTPMPISEQIFAEERLRHTNLFYKTGTELGPALENTVDNKTTADDQTTVDNKTTADDQTTVDDQLQSCEFYSLKLENLKEWVSQEKEGSRTNKSQIYKHIEILTQALNKGYHQVEKIIPAQDIGQVKVDYQVRLTMRSRLDNRVRKLLHRAPKNATSLEQLLADYNSGSGLLAAIRSSSKSQSQLENLGKESAVMAHLDYQIPKNQLKYLIEIFNQQIRITLPNGDSKQIKQVIRRFTKILSRSIDSERGIYRLNKIRFIRASSITHKPHSILPVIKVTNQDKIELSESLGEIDFCNVHSFASSQKGEYVHIPETIKNKLDPSLLSLPMKYCDTIQD